MLNYSNIYREVINIKQNMYINNKFVKTYGSLKECSKTTHIPIQTIIRRCNNETKQFKKYKEYNFKYNVTIKMPND